MIAERETILINVIN